MRPVEFVGDLEGWRAAARPLLGARVAPAEVLWQPHGKATQTVLPGLGPGPGNDTSVGKAPPTNVSIPRAFLQLCEDAILHRDPDRFDRLYRVAFRLTGGEAGLLEDGADPDVFHLERLASAVRRDAHKMQAFVRFRKVTGPDHEHFVAWHRPDHFVLRKVAPFFVDRFRTMRWSIFTPDESAHWDGQVLAWGPGLPAREAPADDQLDELWRTYYAAIFNPARVNPTAMKRHLPVRHWATLPEARAIAPLIAAAQTRTATMADPALTSSARDYLPADAGAGLGELALAANACRGCPLYGPATQTVFGEGPSDARIMLVGEQPGNDEDLAGHPFVGPAGQVLDEALAAADLDRRALYLTNAVKHFKFEVRGKWRIHQRPRGREVAACRPWLMAELQRVRPTVLVALGATAAGALFGPQVTLARDRGRAAASDLAPLCLVTYHPAAALRAGDPAASKAVRAALVEDLRRARLGLQTTVGNNNSLPSGSST